MDFWTRVKITPFAVFLCFLFVLVCVQSSVALIDPPAGLLTWSADLLTDQGFHTKAAQLWAKFGRWALPFDTDFRPAAPLYNVIMGGVFRIFGVHAATLAGYAIAVNALTLLVAHAIARSVFRPWAAVAVAVSFALCFPSFSFARLALIEPTAILFALLAILFYVRGPSVSALCISLGFAAAAFMTKVHFVSIVAAVCAAWLLDIRRLARTDPPLARRHGAALGLMLLLTAAMAASYAYAFATQIADFKATVATTIAGGFSLRRLLVPFKVLSFEMAYATRLPVMMILVAFYGLVVLWRHRRETVRLPDALASGRPRAILALGLWSIAGIAMLSSLDYRPTRYMLFLVYPLIVLGGYAASRLRPSLARPALACALVATLAYQAPLYARWLHKGAHYSKQQVYGAIVGRIEGQSKSGMIPVVGQEAAELGLRSRRIMPIEADFVPTAHYSLCQRLDYWRPRFYVRLEHDSAEAAPSSCPQISGRTELARYRVLGGYKGDLVLYRLVYRPGAQRDPVSPGVRQLLARSAGSR